MLTPAQVRAADRGEYAEAKARLRDADDMGNTYGAKFEAGFAAGIDWLARRLLGLPPNAPSPLEPDDAGGGRKREDDVSKE